MANKESRFLTEQEAYEKSIGYAQSCGLQGQPTSYSMLQMTLGEYGEATDLTPEAEQADAAVWVWQGPQPSAVLAIMPDEVTLRHARRLLAPSPAMVFLALEGQEASSDAGAPIWRTTSGPAVLDLLTGLDLARRRGVQPVEKPLVGASLPEELNVDNGEAPVSGHLLPVALKPAEKRALDLISDWPWIKPAHLGRLLGVKRSRLSLILQRLHRLGLTMDGEAQTDVDLPSQTGAWGCWPAGTAVRWVRPGGAGASRPRTER